MDPGLGGPRRPGDGTTCVAAQSGSGAGPGTAQRPAGWAVGTSGHDGHAFVHGNPALWGPCKWVGSALCLRVLAPRSQIKGHGRRVNRLGCCGEERALHSCHDGDDKQGSVAGALRQA